MLLSKILFSNGDKHFRAEDIQKIILKKGLKISLATIYNNLNQFTKVGLLRQRSLDNHRTFFDNNVSDHYHLFDEEKNKLIDIPTSSINFSKLPKIPKNKKIKNINVVISLEKFAK